jgi:hypothetical protein
MTTKLRLTAADQAQLMKHLFPGDGLEAVSFALCGRHHGKVTNILLCHEVHSIPYDQCTVRKPDLVTWKSDALEPLLEKAARKHMGLVKFHSHPTDIWQFSSTDDRSDANLFPSIHGWVDDNQPHASVIVMPNGDLIGREVLQDGTFRPLESILTVGDDISLATSFAGAAGPAYAERHAQLFGSKTTALLGTLAIGVVGCSGTGGHVIEMLSRLGVRRLVLVDPDRVEYRNLNRILGTTTRDAALRRLKVEVLAEHVARIGLGTEIASLPSAIGTRAAVQALAPCDVIFGCVDSHDGRRTLSRLSRYYLIPYFDCGVSLSADGGGGIDKVVAASHYFHPDGSTPVERRVINQDRANSESMARLNPAEYAKLHAQGYLKGVDEDRPAVISVNALAASLVVNEFLARIHPYRYESNRQYASVRVDLTDLSLEKEPEQDPAISRLKHGRGDVEPLLEMSDLSPI